MGKGAFYVNSLIGIFSCLAASLFGWHEMSTFVFVYMVEFFFFFFLFFCLLSSFLVISTFAKKQKAWKDRIEEAWHVVLDIASST